MTRFLISKFIPDWTQTSDKDVRSRYCMLAGILGLICNFILFCIKLAVGSFLGSIAIVSDAFNNLSDMGTSGVSIISAKLSNQRPDADHPFGHGRFEYISSLFVGILILLVGYELGKSSFEKILHPEVVDFALVPVIILALSVSIKVWMFLYNRYMGRQIGSTMLKAAAQDSINDVISTSAVIVCTVIGIFLPFSIDGYVGVAVALLILRSGFGIIKDTVGLLLGSAPDPETVTAIRDLLLSSKEITGVHDLIVNDYGPGRCIASVHAEVPADRDIIHVHEVIDALEHQAQEELDLLLVIHMDPIVTDNPFVNELRQKVKDVVISVDRTYSIHDFRITDGDAHINVIFDVEVPISQKNEMVDENLAAIREKIREIDGRISCVIAVDRYIPQSNI